MVQNIPIDAPILRREIVMKPSDTFDNDFPMRTEYNSPTQSIASGDTKESKANLSNCNYESNNSRYLDCPYVDDLQENQR